MNRGLRDFAHPPTTHLVTEHPLSSVKDTKSDHLVNTKNEIVKFIF